MEASGLVIGIHFGICGLGMWLGGVWQLVADCLLEMEVHFDACGLGNAARGCFCGAMLSFLFCHKGLCDRW